MLCLGIKTKQAFVIQTQLGVFSLWSNLKKTNSYLLPSMRPLRTPKIKHYVRLHLPFLYDLFLES